MAEMPREPTGIYEPPEIVELGPFAEVTAGCNKNWGDTDGFMFQGTPIACMSA